MRRLAFVASTFAAVFASLALAAPPLAAQQAAPVFTRVNGTLYRAEQGKLFLVDMHVISVRFAPGVTADAVLPLGLSVVRSNVIGVVDLELPAGADPVETVAALREAGLVSLAEVNTFGTYSGIPNDPQFGTQWNLNNVGQSGGKVDADVDAPEAWEITGGAPSVAVAIVDSGSLITHPDLAANVWKNLGEIAGNGVDDDGNGFIDDTVGWNFDANNNNPVGAFYHGTAVAGVVGAVGNNGVGIAGLAGGGSNTAACHVMPLNIGSFAPNTAVLDDGILYAANNGARVITMSLQVPITQVITDAIAYAVNTKGCFVDCAAGNNGVGVSYPANLPTVMAVASTNRFDVKSGFSNSGPEVAVAAPGEQILMLDLNNGYTTQDGTSFAAPHVAGLAGLLFAANPSLTAADVSQIIKDTADDVGPPGFDTGTGFGRINAATALSIATGGVIGKAVLYGTGLAGADGAVPIMGTQGGTPKVGNAAFSVTVRKANPLSPVALVLGFAQGSVPFKGGTLLVDVTGPYFLVLLTSSATGNAAVPLPIGADPALAGLELDLQWIVQDAAAVHGFALSQGLQVIIGS